MKCYLTMLAALFCQTLLAQQLNFSGIVLLKDGVTPLTGATVRSSLSSVATNGEGKFTIPAKPGEEVTISYIGMQTITYVFSGDTARAVIVTEYAPVNLNQVVVVGYQTQKKADLTGAVAVVNLADVKNIPQGSVTKALQGRIPGVQITTDGSPEGGSTVRIRGIGTLNNNNPLYIIDGIPSTRGLEEINQADIESFQVLKDASSATIYGSRAANGVIIITTRKGRKGSSHIDINASSSLQYYNTKLHMLNAEQRGRAYWQASVNDGSNPNNNQIYQYDWNGDFASPVLNKIIYPEFIDAARTMKPANTNWFDQIGGTSLLQNYNVAFTNGKEKSNTFFSVGFYDNKGIVKETHMQKITMRLNSDFSFFNGRLKVGENLNASYIKDRLIPVGDVLFTALVQQPIVPVHTLAGGWGGPAPGMTDRQNPIRLINDNRQNASYFGRIIGNIYADLTIVNGLHLRTSYGIDYNGMTARTLRKSYVSGFLSDPSNLVNNYQSYDGNLIWQNTLNYDVTTGQSRWSFLAGQESIQIINRYFAGSRQGYAQENIDYAYLDAGSTNILNTGNGYGYSLLSYFGKLNYSFDGRYLASVTMRRDGSSRFGTNNRWGSFPSASLGWRLSQESFMKEVSWLSDLKLRYGYGQTGNQSSGNYAIYSLYSALYSTDPTWTADRGTAYDLRGTGTGTLPSGFVKVQDGNPSLKWESTKESNFGIDFGILNQKITGSIDYFIKNTSDILITPGYLAVIGEGGTKTFNGGSMRNTGIEALVSYNGTIGKDISLEVTGNIATYRNKVTYLPDEVLTAYPGNGASQTILGHSINSTFGYVADGIFQDQDEVDKAPAQPGKRVGRLRFRDLTGDGIVDANDRTYITDGNPKLSYGLNISAGWKELDLSLFFQGIQGLMVYNTYKTYTDFSSLWPGTNWGDRVQQAWTPQSPGSSIPALTLVDNNNEGRTSTYFLESGSYLKLRNLQVGYHIKNALRGMGVQRLRVYLQANNLFTVKSKSYTAADPENPSGAYPIPTITTLGVDINF